MSTENLSSGPPKETKATKHWFYTWKGLAVVSVILTLAAILIIHYLFRSLPMTSIQRILLDLSMFLGTGGIMIPIMYFDKKRQERWTELEKLCECGHENIKHGPHCYEILRQEQIDWEDGMSLIAIQRCLCKAFKEKDHQNN